MNYGLSYAAGPTKPPIPAGTIGDWLDRAAKHFGDRPALVAAWQDVRWTWAELRNRVEALARGLNSLGLNVGDRVGICAPNCAEWVLTQLATARLGLILVPVNPAYRTHELGHALRLGEHIWAWVRTHRLFEPSGIADWCRGRIAHRKVPATIRILDAFPMTVTGKVQNL